MSPETNLDYLLAGLSPVLQDTDYVFCCVENPPLAELDTMRVLAVFREVEGLTLILPRAEAERAGYTFDGVFGCITLAVESSLHAVGLTAAVASALAREGIAANVVAAFHHDHVFVPVDQTATAMEALRHLSA